MNIESQFQDVRNLYFPRWDKSHEWDVVYGTLEQLRGNTGYCDTDAKTVYLDRDSMEQFALAEVRAFIIHEICLILALLSINAGGLREWRSQPNVQTA